MEPNQESKALPGWEEMLVQFQDLFAAGGPVLFVIAAASVLALAIILLKLLEFWHLGLARRGFLESALSAWHAGNQDFAISVLARTRNPIARTLEIAMRGTHDACLDRRDLEQRVAHDGAARLITLRRYLRGLELVATLSPLLGLLGTVLGMIDAFQALEEAGSRVDPALLSGGIWVALLTTAAGLTVAIPAAGALALFEGAVEGVAHSMEDAVSQVLLGPNRSPPDRPHTRVEPLSLTAETLS